MKTRSWLVLGLLSLNLVLGVGLYGRMAGDKPAFAQAGGRSTYLYGTGIQGVVYALDTKNGTLVTFAAGQNGKNYKAMDVHNVQADLDRAASRAD